MTDARSISKAELLALPQEREAALERTSLVLQEKSTALQEKDAALQEKDAALQEKDAALQEKDAALEQQRERLREQDVQRQADEQTIATLAKERDEYKLALEKLMQQRFRNRSERYLDNPDQLRLDFGNTDDAADAAAGLGEAVEELQQVEGHQRRRTRREPEGLPEHLERYEVVAAAPDSVKNCETHGERTLLPESMWDSTERLEFQPPRMRVRVTKYPKYACPGEPECGVSSPERPTGIVEGERALKAFQASELARRSGTIIGVEEELRGQISPDCPDLLGRVDLLVDQSDELVLVDFKTARSRWTRQQAESSGEQLLLYSELAKELMPGRRMRLEFGVVTKAKSPVVESLPVTVDQGRIRRTRKVVERTWRAMNSGIVYPSPSPMNCASCPYRQPCGEWAG